MSPSLTRATSRVRSTGSAGGGLDAVALLGVEDEPERSAVAGRGAEHQDPRAGGAEHRRRLAGHPPPVAVPVSAQPGRADGAGRRHAGRQVGQQSGRPAATARARRSAGRPARSAAAARGTGRRPPARGRPRARPARPRRRRPIPAGEWRAAAGRPAPARTAGGWPAASSSNAALVVAMAACLAVKPATAVGQILLVRGQGDRHRAPLADGRAGRRADRRQAAVSRTCSSLIAEGAGSSTGIRRWPGRGRSAGIRCSPGWWWWHR